MLLAEKDNIIEERTDLYHRKHATKVFKGVVKQRVIGLKEGFGITGPWGWADFHLDRPRALEIGTCYYPIKVD